MTTITRGVSCAAVFVLSGFTAGGAGRKAGPATRPHVSDSMYGPDLYRSYCATCHGGDGKGNQR